MTILRYSLIATLLFVFCFACNNDATTTSREELKIATGDVYYGKVFRYNEESYFRNLFPLKITGTIGSRIAYNVYEGLVTMSQDSLKIEPALAESWVVSDDGLTYTFKIRQGVEFHNDECFPNGKGRPLTANDIKFNFDLLCSKIEQNAGFWIFENKVLGASEHYVATKEGKKPEGGVKGIKVLDDYTLEIKLEQAFPDFIRLLVTNFTLIYPREAYEKYGAKGMRVKMVGTGPFKLTKVKENEMLILRRNENYWGKDKHGNKLPYLDGIRVSFIKDQKAGLLEFMQGNLDMIYRLPFEMVDEIMDEKQQLKPDFAKYQLQMEETLSYEYYGFQHKTKPFNKKKLRQAFCYAIDREKITTYVTKRMSTPDFNGVVPRAFKKVTGYNVDEVKGYSFNPEKARKLLSEAGYPNGKGLEPITLQINSGGGKNAQVAEAVQKQLQENLNVKINILQLQFAQHYENLETGKANLWRAGWIADYTSPENFLRLYYGPEIPETLGENSYINTVRYDNPEYNQLFEAALNEMDEQKRNELYVKADQKLMDDAVGLPLFFSNDVRLLQANVQNFPQNAMEYRYFKNVYFSPIGENMLE